MHRLDCRQGPLDDEQMARIADDLRAGRVAVLPTETVYGLAAAPGSEGALRAIKERSDQPFTLHLAEAGQAPAHAVVPPAAERLMARYWPGPLTLVLTARTGGTIGLRVPAHDLTRRILAITGPLFMSSVNRTGEPPLTDPAAIEQAFADRIEWLVDVGPSRRVPSTVVRATGPEIEVLREGLLRTEDIHATAARTVLFVCTGNTCRSPLAEALARSRLATALGTTPDRLPARGLRLASAGIATLAGMPASEGAIGAARETGLDLRTHRSRPLDPALAAGADRIYCLARSHLARLQADHPDVAGRAELLDPAGQDIGDPFGGDLTAYRTTRDAIAAALDARVEELAALADT